MAIPQSNQDNFHVLKVLIGKELTEKEQQQYLKMAGIENTASIATVGIFAKIMLFYTT